MANVFICWEQGGGWGHVQSLRPLIRQLLHHGHRVTFAARELGRSLPTFAGLPVRLLQAPLLATGPKPRFANVACFAHVLANIGYDAPGNLIAAVAGWRGLFELVQPTVVLAEYAPTALLALRGTAISRAAVGTGFSLPPDTSPLPAIVGPDRTPLTLDCIAQDEADVLASVNAALNAWAGKPLGRLAGLFHDELDAAFLRTYPELDPFGPRPAATYCGAWPSEGGAPPHWPTGSGPKLFVYSRPCAAREAILAHAQRLALPTLVAAEGLSPQAIAHLNAPTLRVAATRLDIQRVAAECDVAVLNAGHNTLATILLAGKPCLLLPLQMEQYLLARQAQAMGAAHVASPHDPPAAIRALDALLADPAAPNQAMAFAQRHGQADPNATQTRLEAVVGIVEAMALRV